MSNSTESALWTFLHSRLLGGQRIRAMAIILVFCLWSVCLVDYAKPGIFDRAGNIKFQDFLQFPISARLIASGHVHQRRDFTLKRCEVIAPEQRPFGDAGGHGYHSTSRCCRTPRTSHSPIKVNTARTKVR